MLLLGQRAGPGALAGGAPAGPRQARAGLRQRLRGGGDRRGRAGAPRWWLATWILALAASRANAELNGVELSYSADFFAEDDRFDLILVADVLYDRANLPLLDQFLSRGRQALVADSGP